MHIELDDITFMLSFLFLVLLANPQDIAAHTTTPTHSLFQHISSHHSPNISTYKLSLNHTCSVLYLPTSCCATLHSVPLLSSFPKVFTCNFVSFFLFLSFHFYEAVFLRFCRCLSHSPLAQSARPSDLMSPILLEATPLPPFFLLCLRSLRRTI